MTDSNRDAWQERSRSWAASAAQGRSADDTFNQMVVAEAGIRPGEDVLDTASGTGNPAVTIALSMDGAGSVTCSDFTPRMLETARGRAQNLSLAIMRFAACDMTALAFANETFDCVTCRFGLMSVDKDRRVLAAREALRVLRPGGRVVYVVWGAYEENPPFVVPRRTVARFLGEDEGKPPGRHSMSAPGTLTAILDAAGFARSEERELRYRNRVENPQEYVKKGLTRSFAEQVEGLSAERRAALERAVLEAWQPHMEGGVLQVPNYARLGIGWKRA